MSDEEVTFWFKKTSHRWVYIPVSIEGWSVITVTLLLWVAGCLYFDVFSNVSGQGMITTIVSLVVVYAVIVLVAKTTCERRSGLIDVAKQKELARRKDDRPSFQEDHFNFSFETEKNIYEPEKNFKANDVSSLEKDLLSDFNVKDDASPNS